MLLLWLCGCSGCKFLHAPHFFPPPLCTVVHVQETACPHSFVSALNSYRKYNAWVDIEGIIFSGAFITVGFSL